jgi:DNA-binding MarR family transcriptional regulator
MGCQSSARDKARYQLSKRPLTERELAEAIGVDLQHASSIIVRMRDEGEVVRTNPRTERPGKYAMKGARSNLS